MLEKTHRETTQSINKLCQEVQKYFSEYRQAKAEFYHALELWLWCMPLLQYEDNQQLIIAEIMAAIQEKIANEEIADILKIIREITKKKVAKLRCRNKPVYDPQLIDKITSQKPRAGHKTEELLPTDMKKLSPLSRLLLSLVRRGISKKEIAQMLFVQPSQVTNYFKKLHSEIREIGEREIP